MTESKETKRLIPPEMFEEYEEYIGVLRDGVRAIASWAETEESYGGRNYTELSIYGQELEKAFLIPDHSERQKVADAIIWAIDTFCWENMGMGFDEICSLVSKEPED